MTTPAHGIERVPLGSLKRYLAASGWHRRVLPSGVELFAKGPEDDDIEIVLPETAHARDLLERLTNALITLTAMERRPVEEVVAAIRAISYDLVRSRLPDAAIRHDTIKLGTAEEFIRRMTKILAASAHGELHGGPYFQRVSSVAQKYADECRFGHTFRGSFGFMVESRVGPRTEDVGEPAPAPPLERRAIQRFARGLRIIEAAIEHEDHTEIVRGYESGLNANACEELLGLVETPQVGEVKFEVVFSPEWGVPPDLGPALSMEIKQARGVEVIREAAKALRVVNYEKQRTITGKVRTLHSMETPADLFSISGLQDVIVEWDSEEFGKRNVRVSLGPEEYLQALEAHTDGRSISVFGELEQGRQWRLENARNFRLL